MAERNDTTDDRSLDLLLSNAREMAPKPDPAFLSRLEADMEAMRPKGAKRTRDRQSATDIPWFQGLFAASGLSGAAALGVWIGFLMPETLNGVAESFSGDTTVGIEAFLPFTDVGALGE